VFVGKSVELGTGDGVPDFGAVVGRAGEREGGRKGGREGGEVSTCAGQQEKALPNSIISPT
jgi:hypothetical protein